MKKYIEREIITGCIVSDQYLRDFIDIYKPEFINAKAAKKIISWCITHYQAYKKAPFKDISTIYQSNLNHLPEDEADWIGEVLEFLSDVEDEQTNAINVPYLVDQTKEYFEERSVKILAEKIEIELSNGNTTAAIDLATKYKTVERPADPGIDPYKGTKNVKDAFLHATEPLIHFPGALGYLMNPQLVREGFVAIMAGEKIGKTFWQSELKFAGMMSNRSIAFFQAGDMSQNQQMVRWHIYMAGRSNKARYCKKLLIPTLDCFKNQTGTCDRSPNTEFPFEGMAFTDFYKNTTMEGLSRAYQEFPNHIPCYKCQKKVFKFKGAPWFRTREEVEPLTWKGAIHSRNQFMKRRNITDAKVRLATYPAASLSVKDIDRQLNIWEEKEGFLADIIVVDYADLLIASKGVGDVFRHQQNQIWMELRGLSQKRKALVITGTQADAGSYGKHSIDQSNYSEDKRKYGHVTAMYSLNKTNEEKKIGIMRLGEIVIREDEFYTDRQVVALGRLEIGRPHLASYFV